MAILKAFTIVILSVGAVCWLADVINDINNRNKL
jgi:hypothetical protein